MNKFIPTKDVNQGNRKVISPTSLLVMGQPAGWKPLNGTLRKSQSANLFQLDHLNLIYKRSKGEKPTSEIYFISRDFLQQDSIEEDQAQGIEPCQTLSDEHYFFAQIGLSEREER